MKETASKFRYTLQTPVPDSEQTLKGAATASHLTLQTTSVSLLTLHKRKRASGYLQWFVGSREAVSLASSVGVF